MLVRVCDCDAHLSLPFTKKKKNLLAAVQIGFSRLGDANRQKGATRCVINENATQRNATQCKSINEKIEYAIVVFVFVCRKSDAKEKLSI